MKDKTIADIIGSVAYNKAEKKKAISGIISSLLDHKMEEEISKISWLPIDLKKKEPEADRSREAKIELLDVMEKKYKSLLDPAVYLSYFTMINHEYGHMTNYKYSVGLRIIHEFLDHIDYERNKIKKDLEKFP